MTKKQSRWNWFLWLSTLSSNEAVQTAKTQLKWEENDRRSSSEEYVKPGLRWEAVLLRRHDVTRSDVHHLPPYYNMPYVKVPIIFFFLVTKISIRSLRDCVTDKFNLFSKYSLWSIMLSKKNKMDKMVIYILHSIRWPFSFVLIWLKFL